MIGFMVAAFLLLAAAVYGAYRLLRYYNRCLTPRQWRTFPNAPARRGKQLFALAVIRIERGVWLRFTDRLVRLTDLDGAIVVEQIFGRSAFTPGNGVETLVWWIDPRDAQPAERLRWQRKISEDGSLPQPTASDHLPCDGEAQTKEVSSADLYNLAVLIGATRPTLPAPCR